MGLHHNTLPNDKIIDMLKLKANTDEKLTLSQTTNFKFFQIERVDRQQFQI